MSSTNVILKPNTKILLGIFWIILAIIYISDRVTNNLNFRLFDWICWIAMFLGGITFITEGLRAKKTIQ
jgi:hypothetical protein